MLRYFGIVTLALLIFWLLVTILVGIRSQGLIFGILFGISVVIFALPIYLSKYNKKRKTYNVFKEREEKALRLSNHGLDT